jgi:predicted enzyme related to lactoylglutathione lyase
MTSVPHSANVWAEIPVTDLTRAMAFYADLLGQELTLETDGPNPMAMFVCDMAGGGTGGHLYPGKPAAAGTGATVHLAVPGKVEDAMARCTKAGGQVVSPIVTIPPGRFAYALDPDGNSIGLFEVAA